MVSALSTDLSTQEIGFEFSVTQYEDNDLIQLNVDPYQTDGSSVIGDVEIRSGDTLQVSVVGQGIELEANGFSFNNKFTVPQSSLSIPATLQVQFIRTGGQVSALETFITINGLFESTIPANGTVFSSGETVDFTWAIRDSDGNTVDTENEVTVLNTQTNESNFRLRSFQTLAFDPILPGPDGLSKMASVPAISLVPPEALDNGDSAWELSIKLDRASSVINLPTEFSVDAALGNFQLNNPSDLRARVITKEVVITVQ